MEQATLAVRIGTVDAVEKERVEVRRPSQVAVRALEHRHRARFSVGQRSCLHIQVLSLQ
jgi:hypothetical protein